MSKRPNGSRRGSRSYISTLAITAALFAIAALTASPPSSDVGHPSEQRARTRQAQLD